ncbi:MAG: hypothetical protein HQL96_09800 [Magnetococcales bacterium]|nr:hypothetical protein [Magnetococcales bacterium]
MALTIFPQVGLDGACLLYAMVNAAKALLVPTLSLQTFVNRYQVCERWRKIIAITPQPPQLPGPHRLRAGPAAEAGAAGGGCLRPGKSHT